MNTDLSKLTDAELDRKIKDLLAQYEECQDHILHHRRLADLAGEDLKQARYELARRKEETPLAPVDD